MDYISGYKDVLVFFFSSRRRHTRCGRDWSSDVCSSDLRQRGAHRAPRRDAHARARRSHPAVDLSAGAGEGFGSSRLVRPGGSPVPRRGDGHVDAVQPFRGPALRSARERRPRIEPPRRGAGGRAAAPRAGGMSDRDVEASPGPLLVVVPAAAKGASGISPSTVIAGLPLITRIVRAAKSSGYADVLVCDMDAATRGLVEGAGAAVLRPSRSADDR